MKLFLRYIGLSLLCVILIANTGCGKEDAIEVQQDLYEVIVDKPVVRIGHNEEVNVNVMLGNGGYSVKSYNEQVATATVDGEQITIKSGIQNGATTVEVTDAEGIKTDISVNVGLFELEFNEQTIEMEVNEEKELIVTMGNFSSNDELTYSIKLLFPIISTPALQNAEIEWKIPYQIPLITPNSGINLIMNSTAPIPSTRNVPFKILMINLTIPDRVSKPYACWINILPFILMRFPRIRKKDAVHAITPSPPICIRIIIMN